MIRRGWILGGLLALAPAVSQAALVMLVDGVPGPSALQNYSGWFNVDRTNWGIDRSNTAAPHKLTVSLNSSASVATLLQASASGIVFTRLVVDQIFVSDNPSPMLQSRMTCEGAAIRSFSSSAQPDDVAHVELDIRCGKLLWEYFDFNSQKALARSAKGSWNFKTNTP